MTPADLLAACREAWPDGPGSRWELGRDPSDRRVHQCRRSLDVFYAVAEVDMHPNGTCFGRITDGDWYWDHVRTSADAGPGVIVATLRAWCREEARRLAEEVDPGGGWLPVTDDAPPAGEEVLVVGSWAGMRVGMRLEDGAWAGAGYSLRDIGATAVRWRPLPAPPGSAPSGSKR